MDREKADPAAVGFHDRLFGDRPFAIGVIRAFAVNIRSKLREDGNRVSLSKDGHVVDRLKRGDGLRAILFADHRPQIALDGAHAGVAVQADDQDIAEGFGVAKAADMADMKEVEAPVGPDNCFAGLCPRCAKRQELFEGLELRDDVRCP
jgi:hypothetical protein